VSVAAIEFSTVGVYRKLLLFHDSMITFDIPRF
jgi:hypothetical protein